MEIGNDLDSDEEELNSFREPADTKRPWLWEFDLYLDAIDYIPEGQSIVLWWGVCQPFFLVCVHII